MVLLLIDGNSTLRFEGVFRFLILAVNFICSRSLTFEYTGMSIDIDGDDRVLLSHYYDDVDVYARVVFFLMF